jgi:hypothetical protein
MPNRAVLPCTFMLAILLAACAPLVSTPEAPLPLPSASEAWTIKLTQTGGLAGVRLVVEITSDGRLKAENPRAGVSVNQAVSPQALSELRRLYTSAMVATPAGPKMSCADCFHYSVEITSAGQTMQVQLDDTTIAASGMADLIHYLQQLRDRALRSGA